MLRRTQISQILSMIFSVLFLMGTAFHLAHSLQCLHNSTVTNAVYNNGMLIRADSSTYDMGVMECSAKLTRCVNFKAMDISFFKTLDVAQDETLFIDLIKGSNGKVLGRACMSEADCAKLNAIEADDCSGKPKFECFCTTDECTGASGGTMTLISSFIMLLYIIFY
ncbi:hypothetical protein PRIPAC_78205 [Pristionchus pacificus]|uniref:Uncharacterized protein n=1 Tax=Pristionchus pacificus TaxID=54126 RepID=A0A2A6C409_PRIPA|nr:hypothetical protein PRIPAC_78205 [Pristionchus pacificus]|eukprot:PDM72783.1 hypothetical protein PRIPAC_39217 [Pristionchus pacificus]